VHKNTKPKLYCTDHIAELKPGGLFQKIGHLQELKSSLLFNLSSYKVGLSKKQPKAKPYHVGKPSQTKQPRSRTQSLHVHSPCPLRTETKCIHRTAKKLLTSHKIESQINSKKYESKEEKIFHPGNGS
jgi:hypothetical protein